MTILQTEPNALPKKADWTADLADISHQPDLGQVKKCPGAQYLCHMPSPFTLSNLQHRLQDFHSRLETSFT